ncbi:MAG: hypothetical protein ACR2KV_00895 [Solirubrobacteraceae bacterium]
MPGTALGHDTRRTDPRQPTPTREGAAQRRRPGPHGLQAAGAATIAQLQRTAGNAAVSRLVAALPARPGAGTARVLQRTVDGDLAAGYDAVTRAASYQEAVDGQISRYSHGVSQLGQSADARLEDYATNMAAGFKVWGENFYNKATAYLYEGDLAAQHTQLHRNPNTFAILGVDTDENPDMELVQEHVDVSTGALRTQVTGRAAVEVKASTTSVYASFDQLVANGMKQLKKRELTGRPSYLVLIVHNDNPDNHWPVTDHVFATMYGGAVAHVPPTLWSTRLAERAASLKATNQITLPVHVEAHQQGTKYAEASV